MIIQQTTNTSALDRNVVCILGLPFDKVSLESTREIILEHIRTRKRCFLSTPNVNWLTQSELDQPLRDSVFDSDLSIVDGMPIIWISKLLGLPIRERVAGSDLFSALETIPDSNKIRVFFFGGDGNAAQRAMEQLNNINCSIEVVGAINPGYGTIHEMSSDLIIKQINEAKSDFLVVSLGASKGQQWIRHNLSKLDTPVISHLGAVVNFYAGTIQRAPKTISRIGLEWAWRIYQEPSLYARYLKDACYLLARLFKNILPYWFLLNTKYAKLAAQPGHSYLAKKPQLTIIYLVGSITEKDLQKFLSHARDSLGHQRPIEINFEHCSYIDAAFTGSLLLLYHQCKRRKSPLKITGPSKTIKRILKLQNAAHLISDSEAS